MAGDITIGIVAGEASGDALAATLIHAVRARLPQARFVGIAGPKMEAAGCEAWYPLETLAVRGFAEVVGHLPELVRIRRAYKTLYRAGLTIEEARAAIAEAAVEAPVLAPLVAFLAEPGRGIVR